MIARSSLPDVITRYYDAAAADDLDAVLACLAPDAHVLDENTYYNGIAEIRGWREKVASASTYTTEISGVESAGTDEYVVSTHLEGDFPGGVVDLEQRFTVRDGLVAELLI